jgi:hypothetical protein
VSPRNRVDNRRRYGAVVPDQDVPGERLGPNLPDCSDMSINANPSIRYKQILWITKRSSRQIDGHL